MHLRRSREAWKKDKKDLEKVRDKHEKPIEIKLEGVDPTTETLATIGPPASAKIFAITSTLATTEILAPYCMKPWQPL